MTIDAQGQRAQYSAQFVKPASLSGQIWQDDNDDGLLSGGEYGLEGVEVSLRNDAGEQLQTLTTERNGDFSFTGLTPGVYRVTITLPEGMIFARVAPGTDRIVQGIDSRTAESEAYTLVSGQRLDGLMAGAVSASAVSGMVWEDLNGDTYADVEEAPMADIEIVLLQLGEVVHTTRTDEHGRYQLNDLRPGDYTLRITLPEGCLFTTRALDATIDDDGLVLEQGVRLRRWSEPAVVSAGVQHMASVSARVWFDMDDTGEMPADGGYAGITVQLLSGVDATSPALEDAITDATGTVRFDHLRPGNYTLRFGLPEEEGWGFTAGVVSHADGWGVSETILLGSGESLELSPVGFTQMGSISGVAFVDANYNGLRDDGEPSLEAQVALLDSAGNLLRETITDENGAYAFDGLRTGQYIVRFTVDGEYAFTQVRMDAPSFNSDVPEGPGPSAQTSDLYLPLGERLLIDVGAYAYASVSGQLWQDTNNTGDYSEENPPVSGQEVELMRDGETIAKILTDETGAYQFDGLKPGLYTIRVTLPQGTRFSIPSTDAGQRRSLAQMTDELTGETRTLVLESGQKKGEIDLGIIYTGAVMGQVISLKDGKGLDGVTVQLIRDGHPALETATASDGRYAFEDIRPGTAEIRFTVPEGWAVDSEAINPATVEILQGQAVESVDLEVLPEATIEGFLWLDGDANGIASENEAPLTGAEVSLVKMAAETPVEYASAQTDASGRFLFDKLLPGEYKLQVTVPANVCLYGEAETPAFILEMGTVKTHNIPAYTASTIEGMVWEDLNNDGLRTSDEPVLSDIPVALMSEGTILMEAFTNERGGYRFEEIPPVDCSVRITLPEGYLFTTPAQGGSVIAETNERIAETETFYLTMGEAHTDINAGALRQARIGDLVWLDENGNGLQDTNEPGIAGITVTLLNVLPNGLEEEVAHTVSDSGGHYRFDAVRPGTYRVAFTLGDEYVPTKPVEGLIQISSKLPFEDAEIVMTAAFDALSGRHVLTIDAGLLTREMAAAFGWYVPEEVEAFVTLDGSQSSPPERGTTAAK